MLETMQTPPQKDGLGIKQDLKLMKTIRKQKKQSNPFYVSTGDPRARHPPERRLLILGGPQSGKTSTANSVLGDEVFDIGTETTHSNVGQTEIYGRRVTVVDTPPWAIPADPEDNPEADDEGENAGAESDDPPPPPPPPPASLDSEGPCMGAILCPPGPHAILLVVSISQPFTDTERRAAEEQLGALGGGTWRYSMVVFTGVDKLPKGVFIEEHIANTGEALQWLVERCGSRYSVSLSLFELTEQSISELWSSSVSSLCKCKRNSHKRLQHLVVKEAA